MYLCIYASIHAPYLPAYLHTSLHACLPPSLPSLPAWTVGSRRFVMKFVGREHSLCVEEAKKSILWSSLYAIGVICGIELPQFENRYSNPAFVCSL